MKTEVIIKQVRKDLNECIDRIDSYSDAYEFEAKERDMICYFKVAPIIVRTRKGVDVTLDWETEPFLFFDKSNGYKEGPEISKKQFSEIEEELKKVFAEVYLEEEEERIREAEEDYEPFDER